MENRYASLELYNGCCNSDGFNEGWFVGNYAEPELVKRLPEARRIIEKGLAWKTINVFDGLVTKEEDILKLIVSAKKKIARAYEAINPTDCHHGTIQFSRGIKIRNPSEDDVNNLVEACIESEVVPKYNSALLFTLYYKSSEREFKGKTIQQLHEAIQKDPRVIWRISIDIN